MNFTNINDPAGVKALLDQLRVSQAWKDVVSSQETQPSSSVLEQQPGAIPTASNAPGTSASVAALLSQLQSSPSHPIPPNKPVESALPPPSFDRSSKKVLDPRSLTFQQALPLIAQLADDPQFVAAVTQLKKEQDDLERQLWEERRNIFRKYEEKVKVAATKATMIGDAGLSKHEADMLQDGLRKALVKFDRERVLVAWDGLVSKQQLVLSQHSVPTMFPTTRPADHERQHRVMDVLEGVLRS